MKLVSQDKTYVIPFNQVKLMIRKSGNKYGIWAYSCNYFDTRGDMLGSYENLLDALTVLHFYILEDAKDPSVKICYLPPSDPLTLAEITSYREERLNKKFYEEFGYTIQGKDSICLKKE